MARPGGDVVSKLQAELLRLSAANPFQVLGIPPFADGDVVRAAYLGAAKRCHPTLFALHGPDARELSNEIFLVIRRAYTELTNDDQRRFWRERIATAAAVTAAAPKPAARGARPSAGASASATGQTGCGRPARAGADPAATDRGRPVSPEERPVPPGARGAARDRGRGPAEQARAHLLHLSWGLEHRQTGHLDEATRELERALTIDPACAEAEKALREVRDKSKKGIFSKIFGRE